MTDIAAITQGMTTADLFARTLIGEADKDGDEGMQAVANVIMNRFDDPKARYGISIRSVILKPYAFSCWLPGPDRDRIIIMQRTSPDYIQALKIVNAAMSGDLPDITQGAKFYFATGSELPSWAKGKEPCVIIGHQEFFNTIE